MINIAFRWVWNRQDAEDIMHQAFLKAWQVGDSIEIKNARPYIYRTMLNIAANHRRSKKIRRWLGLDSDFKNNELRAASDLEKSAIFEQDSTQLQVAVEALAEPLKRVILLYYFYDNNYKEIANVLDLPEGTVASRKNKAMTVLREKLAIKSGKEI